MLPTIPLLLAATLSVTITDEHKSPTPARVYLTNPQGAPSFPSDALVYDKTRPDGVSERHFVPRSGVFSLDLPAGDYRLTVERGKEYLPESRMIRVPAKGSVRHTVQLRRWIDMPSRGWHSADMHLHRPLADVATLLDAEDLTAALPMSRWRTRATSADPQLDAFLQQSDADGVFTTKAGRFFPVLNEELEPPYAAILSSWLGKTPTSLDYPLADYGKRVRAAGGLADSEKATSLDLPVLAALGACDTVGLANNHIWRESSYPLAWGAWPDAMPGHYPPTCEGFVRSGFDMYSALLNAGFPLKLSAGSANGVHPVPPGWSRIYVHTSSKPSPRDWQKALREGRSFVTTGPMLLLRVNGHEPGDEVRGLPFPLEADISLTMHSLQQVASVELVVNGAVKTIALKPHATEAHRYDGSAKLTLASSSWITARWSASRGATCDAAHTSPIYFWNGAQPVPAQPRELEMLEDRVERLIRAGGRDNKETALLLQARDVYREKRKPFAAPTRSSYTPYRFNRSEGWTATNATLQGRKLAADLSSHPHASLVPSDRSLLGTPERLRLRYRGSLAGRSIRVSLHTHFMTFHKTFRAPSGDGEQTLIIDAPPGEGWSWSGGENDGKLHGPLRLAEIRFEAGASKAPAEIELIDIAADVRTDADRLLVLTSGAPNPDRPPSFPIEIRSLAGRPLLGTLKAVYKSWDGAMISSQSLPVVIGPDGQPTQITLERNMPKETQFVEALVSLEVDGQRVADVSPCWVRRPPVNADATRKPASPFGMGVYLDRHGADMEKVAKAAMEAGVKWSREDIGWGEIEKRPGEYHWDELDRRLAIARKYGISVYAIVAYFPEWVKPYSPESITGYAAFLEKLVARYKGDIRHWEIWNEPNIFFWQGPKELYNDLLTLSYAAVKRADPSAQVLGMSTAGIDYNFIARSMARGTPYDALTIHPYRKTLEDGVLMQELQLVSRLAQKPDGTPRPVWITEFGWTTYSPHNSLPQDFATVSERAQANLLARAYLCALVSPGAPNTSWYDFRNDGDDPLYFESNVGVMTRDLRPKPAYAAYRTLTRLFEGQTFAKRLPSPPDVYVMRFEPGGVVAAWSPARDVEVEIDGAGRTIVNAIGETRPAGEGAKLRLTAGVPVYIVAPGGGIR
jgi:hypothetical protein